MVETGTPDQQEPAQIGQKETELPIRKILYVTGFTPFPAKGQSRGGTMKWDLEFTESLAKLGVNIDIISCVGKSETHEPWEPVPKGGTISFEHIQKSDISRAQAEALRRILHTNSDVCHVSSRILFNDPEISSALAEAGKPIIWTLTGPAVLKEINSSQAKACESIVCMSEGLRSMAINIGIPDSKIYVVPNIIDTDKEKPLGQAVRKKIREEHGIPDDAVVYLAAGRISPEKQLDNLISVWREFLGGSSNRKKYLFILGSVASNNAIIGAGQRDEDPMGRLYENIKKKRSSNVIAPGWANVGEYLAAADFNISTSNMEGLSNVLLESAARERPIIGPQQTPGFKEIIEPASGGFLYDLTSRESLITALNNSVVLLTTSPSKYKDMCKRVRKRVAQYCHPKKVAKNYLAIYSQSKQSFSDRRHQK